MMTKYYSLHAVLTTCFLLALPQFASAQEPSFLSRFTEIRAEQSNQLPTLAQQQLLQHYKPVLFLPAKHAGPMDFYADYIANGCLATQAQPQRDCAINQRKLNAVKDDPSAIFVYNNQATHPTPTGYGAVYHGTVTLPGLKPEQREWTFLRYNFVFAHSGIAAGIKPWQALALGVAGNLDDWHQLDNYTGAVVVLDEQEKPVAVMLQQHNYMRTYLVGTDPAFPPGDPFAIDVAIRSNEFYPHRATPQQHRASDFLSGESAAWLIGQGEQRLTDTFDHTAAATKIAYELKFLPPDDAFYIFLGSLGAKRMLPGRDGPPGALFYTLPAIWHYEKSLAMFYWVADDTEFVELMHGVGYQNIAEPLPAMQQRLTQALMDNGLVQ